MKKLEIYDPSACCSNQIDPVAEQIADDLRWLAEQGVEVKRYNFAREPQAFAANAEVLKEMGAVMDRLPITVIDEKIVAVGAYLSRDQLAQKLGLADQRTAGCCAPKTCCG
ncbi:MAG: arsD [Proteobacteria bacterium]|nr:arsD [Pseudomonadota bacterium]